MQVTLVIVAFNARRCLAGCLDAVAAQRLRPAEIVVIDNASNDGSADLAAAHPSRPRVVRSGINLGFAAACNLAAREARTEWLAFLNPDAYPEPSWLERLLDATRRHPGVDAFGSTQIDAYDPTRLDGVGDAYFFGGQPFRALHGKNANTLPDEGEVFAPCAAAALWRRERFLALGGFEERFFCYGEDVDLAYRHRLGGGRCVQVPDAVVRHEGSAITGRRSPFTVYHCQRNRVWAHLRDSPLTLLILSLPVFLLLNVALGGKATYHGQISAYLRAMRDAALGAGPFLRERRALHRGRSSTLKIARALTWSPLAMMRRRAKVWNVGAGAGGRARTDTLSPEPDFESGASTSSATPARGRSLAD